MGPVVTAVIVNMLALLFGVLLAFVVFAGVAAIASKAVSKATRSIRKKLGPLGRSLERDTGVRWS